MLALLMVQYLYNGEGLRFKKIEDVNRENGSTLITYTMYSGNDILLQDKRRSSRQVHVLLDGRGSRDTQSSAGGGRRPDPATSKKHRGTYSRRWRCL